MPTILQFDRLVSQQEAFDLLPQVIRITLYELLTEEGIFTIGLHLVDRPEPVFLATLRSGSEPRQWAKADTALRYLKSSLGYRGSIAVELARPGAKR